MKVVTKILGGICSGLLISQAALATYSSDPNGMQANSSAEVAAAVDQKPMVQGEVPAAPTAPEVAVQPGADPGMPAVPHADVGASSGEVAH